MSIATPPVAPRKTSAADQLIEQRIDEARRALWWSELTRTGLQVVIATMLALLAWLIMDQWIYSPGPLVRALCFLSLAAAAGWFLYRKAWPVITSRVTTEYAAWALEQDHPDFRQQLTSYVTLKQSTGGRGVRARVVHAIGSRAASLLKTHDTLPGEATGTFRWWIAAAAILAVLAIYFVASPKNSFASAKRLVSPLANIQPARRVQIQDVQPGHSETLAGRSIDVSAKVVGLRHNEPVWCRWTGDGPDRQSQLELDPSTQRYSGKLDLDHGASGAMHYSIEAGDAIAGPFDLRVQNVPVVAVESIHYTPPQYTGQKPRTTSSPSITVIDGTKVRITAKVNRPVQRAQLQFNPKQLGDTVRASGGIAAMQIATDQITLTSELTLRSANGKAATVEPESYRIKVWDQSEQSNPDPIIYPIRVIPDLPPEVAIVVPQKSPVEVPINGQQTIEVHAMDADFQLQSVSLQIDRGIKSIDQPLIWVKPADGSGKGNQVTEYRFRPLEHQLRVGDVVRIAATAVDNRRIDGDPSVQPNQSTTDAIEIRIVDQQSDLPQDPTGNDGLSQPDDSPASDAQQPQQQDSGGKQSGGQQGGGQSGDSGEATEGQPSDSSDSSQQPDGQNQSNPSGSGGDSQGDSQSSNSGSGGGQSSSDAGGQNPPQSQQQTDPQDPNESGKATGSQDPGGNPADGTPSDGSPSDGQTPANSDPTGGPPKHDGEAFERIKDYLEKHPPEENREGGGGNESGSKES
ncbi:circumsporozoite protein- membrane associated protein, partial [Stieleria sp. TO1_6]|nr:circumsporozoite protein- membrane associated protein [Stieleria tagensis]